MHTHTKRINAGLHFNRRNPCLQAVGRKSGFRKLSILVQKEAELKSPVIETFIFEKSAPQRQAASAWTTCILSTAKIRFLREKCQKTVNAKYCTCCCAYLGILTGMHTIYRDALRYPAMCKCLLMSELEAFVSVCVCLRENK